MDVHGRYEPASKCNFVIFCVLDAGDLDLYQVPGVEISFLPILFRWVSLALNYVLSEFFEEEGRGKEGVHYERFGECYVK